MTKKIENNIVVQGAARLEVKLSSTSLLGDPPHPFHSFHPSHPPHPPYPPHPHHPYTFTYLYANQVNFIKNPDFIFDVNKTVSVFDFLK